MKKQLPYIFLLLLCIAFRSESQIIINEVCSYNGSAVEDEDDDESDWFELFNSGSNIESLMGYSIADNNGEKWFFPDIQMTPGSFLLIFASGKNRTQPRLHTSFKLSRKGDKLLLYNPFGSISDSLVFGEMQLNNSIGRFPDGDNNNLFLFNVPSPAASNNASQHYNSYAEKPVFSEKSGFYNSGKVISISSAASEIRFTTDGSIPDKTSPLYSTVFELNNTNVIRARTFGADSTILPSETVTNTYIVGFSTHLPVISISTNPENLWNEDTGIYVMGLHADSVYPYFGANFWQDWEVPAHVEFFETNKALAFEQDLGLSINGGSVSRTRPQKSFRLTAKNKYGKSKMEHRVFANKSIDEFKVLVLRNSSGDWNKTQFRDGSLHNLLIGNTNIDAMAYRPAAIFLNGQYWGILNIRERVSKYYIEENYSIHSDSLEILEEDSTVIAGNFAEFNQMLDFIVNNDLSIESNFDSASAMLDINSFVDYIVAETFLSNIDWPYNNIKFWKESGPGHKWRYLLIDLDISLGNYGWAPASMDVLGRILGPYGDNNKHVKILRSLLQNTDFRNYFINRYADLVNTLFSAASISEHINNCIELLEPEISNHFQVWGNDMNGWYNEIDNTVFPYINDRPAYALQYIQDTFRLNKQVEVSLNVWPEASGTIRINTIEPTPLPWKGIYFDGVPISITAVANPGYHFVEWFSDNILLLNSKNEQIVLNPDCDNRFTAFFSSSAENNAFFVYPNPASDILHTGFIIENPGETNLQLFTISGSLILEYSNYLEAGPHFVDFETEQLASGIYLLKMNTAGIVKTSKIVIAH